MPIFEYMCKGCGSKFEALVRGSEKTRCPKCHSTRLEQQLSAFAVAVGTGGSTSSASDFGSGPAGGCGPCCGMNGGACAMDDD